MKTTLFKYSILITLFFACSSGPNSDSIEAEGEIENILNLPYDIPKLRDRDNINLNISIVIDLSDRVNMHCNPTQGMSYKDRDIEYIKSVTQAFVFHLANKTFRKVNDRIQVFLEPDPENEDINSLNKVLNFDLDKNNLTFEGIKSLNKNYEQNIETIYELALIDQSQRFSNNCNKIPGSDLYKFFSHDIENKCIKKGYKNIVVVLTDGYMFHDKNRRNNGFQSSFVLPRMIKDFKLNNSDWSEIMMKNMIGFIPVDKKYDVNILMLSFKPSDNNPYEFDVLEKYWSDWLMNMNVTNKLILRSELPNKIDENIKEFILSIR